MSKLISQSTLISQLYLHFFQKLKYYTWGNKNYSSKLFEALVAAIVKSTDEALSDPS